MTNTTIELSRHTDRDCRYPVQRMVTCLFSVDDNARDACLDMDVNEVFFKVLAARHLQRIEFSDDGFASDSVKISIEQCLN